MKPQAYEALQKAKALFRHPAEASGVQSDDIPESVTQAIEPIRRPRVVLLPPNAPKFDAKTIEEENKKMEKQKQDLAQAVAKQKQTDKYVGMSVVQACEACLKRGIKKPADIANETGKEVNQVYTALWKMKQRKAKAKREAKEANRYQFDTRKPTPEFVPPKSLDKVQADWDREPTPFEEAHMVVMRNRADYESIIENLNQRINELLLEKQELNTIIKYLEGKGKNG
jgi:excinuclease UvrABC ATPase subunit